MTITVDTNGDGVPDAGNGVIDDPSERIALATATPPQIEWLRYADAVGGSFLVPMDHDNDGLPRDFFPRDGIPDDIDGSGTLEPAELDLLGPEGMPGYYRQLYARHLYVLAMLLTSEVDMSGTREVYPPRLQPLVNGGTVNLTKSAERARWIAQWAANVVDFRDRDSIMTGFEYDLQPFVDVDGDGRTWDVDGDLTTDDDGPGPPIFRGKVWGCERPELLITETMAIHDVRTEDLNSDGEYSITHSPRRCR